MFWPLHRPRDVDNEATKEVALMSELSPQSQQAYNTQSKLLSTSISYIDPFANTNPQVEVEQYISSHPPRELRYVNCADIQSAFMECIQSGPWKERLMGCDKWSKKVQSCVQMQTELLSQLGLEKAQSIQTYKQISSAADTLCMKWLDEYAVQNKMSPEILNDVYDQRDAIWRKD